MKKIYFVVSIIICNNYCAESSPFTKTANFLTQKASTVMCVLHYHKNLYYFNKNFSALLGHLEQISEFEQNNKREFPDEKSCTLHIQCLKYFRDCAENNKSKSLHIKNNVMQQFFDLYYNPIQKETDRQPSMTSAFWVVAHLYESMTSEQNEKFNEEQKFIRQTSLNHKTVGMSITYNFDKTSCRYNPKYHYLFNTYSNKLLFCGGLRG